MADGKGARLRLLHMRDEIEDLSNGGPGLRNLPRELRPSPDHPRGEVRRAGPVVLAAFYWLVSAAFPAAGEPLLERGDAG